MSSITYKEAERRFLALLSPLLEVADLVVSEVCVPSYDGTCGMFKESPEDVVPRCRLRFKTPSFTYQHLAKVASALCTTRISFNSISGFVVVADAFLPGDPAA